MIRQDTSHRADADEPRPEVLDHTENRRGSRRLLWITIVLLLIAAVGGVSFLQLNRVHDLGDWTHVDTLPWPGGPGVAGSFGRHVVLTEEWVIVSSYYQPGGVASAVHVFDRATRQLHFAAHSHHSQYFEQFGAAIAADQDRLLIGVPGLEGEPSIVERYDLASGERVRDYRLPINAVMEHAGYRLALEGDIAAIGAGPGDAWGYDVEIDRVFVLDINSGEILWMRAHSVEGGQTLDLIDFALADGRLITSWRDRLGTGPDRVWIFVARSGERQHEIAERTPGVPLRLDESARLVAEGAAAYVVLRDTAGPDADRHTLVRIRPETGRIIGIVQPPEDLSRHAEFGRIIACDEDHVTMAAHRTRPSFFRFLPGLGHNAVAGMVWVADDISGVLAPYVPGFPQQAETISLAIDGDMLAVGAVPLWRPSAVSGRVDLYVRKPAGQL